MTIITAADYERVRKELRENCPNRAFPALPDHCWIDSTMFGLTYAPDIGRVMRASLLGCLENLEAAGIKNTARFYTHVESWGLEPIWKTYITRMLLFLLLGDKAQDELICPLVNKWVEDFRKRTFVEAGIPAAPVGGVTFFAIPAILTALAIDDDIVIQNVTIEKGIPGASYFYSGKDYQYQYYDPDLTGYSPRMQHMVLEEKGSPVGHVVVCFICNGHLYLYDNNFGIKMFRKLKTLPTDFKITYKKTKYKGKWYVIKATYAAKANGEKESIEHIIGNVIDGEKEEVQTLINIYILHTRNVYNRVRKGEDILATMLGAPTVKRLTATPNRISTPRIADVRSVPERHDSVESSDSNLTEEDIRDSARLTKYASCIRDLAATTPYQRAQLFNAPDWSPEDQDLQQLGLMSSKFRTLLETIERLDAADEIRYGTKFKHFIFTDLRKGAVGAKAIATYLAAHGYELVLEATKGFLRRKDAAGEYHMVPTKKKKIVLGDHEPEEGGSNRVGLLQGNPLWKSPMGVDLRKQMLAVFNSRPDNIHGEQIRIMVLDSKFKEGIDLYDVKYVHLMEPAITEADLKQAIGRATRYCGQRGLQFVPNVGWKMEVFLYETQFGNAYPFRIRGKEKVFDAHRYMMAHSGLDLGLLEMTRNLTVLAIKSAVDYDLTYKINNFKMQTEIMGLSELSDTIVLSVNPQTGGVVDVKPAVEFNRAKCMPRSNKFFPFTVKRIKEAFRLRRVSGVYKARRRELCKMLEENEEVMQDLITGRKVLQERMKTPALPNRTSTLPTSPNHISALPTSSPSPPASANHISAFPTSSPISPAFGTPASAANSVKGLPRTPYYELFPIPEKPRRLSRTELEEMPDLADFFAAHELAAEANYMAKHANFTDFQAFIRKKYAEYGWAAPVVKNGCEAMAVQGEPVQFSQTQDFVRHYLTPTSPFRGLLAWHSVGTGKTCTAVATATDSFEKAGYSILWVTRNSLMADVWKNVFGAVCSIPVQEYLKRGKKLASKHGTRKKILSKAWFDPISYRSLQNALVPFETGKRKGEMTKLGKALRERNGADPLRKTFLIIDEVHKLLDGDLKPSEYADFEKIAAAIQHSYTISGADSVRVLLMTATPITDNPEGLFRLLNLLIPQESRQFPSMDEFRAKYTTEDGTITAEGEAFFQDRAKGLISYLNREYDPSAFAQPQFHRVKVVASGADLQTDAEIIRDCWEQEEEEDADCNVDDLKTEMAMALEELDAEELPKKELAARKRTLKAEYKERIDDCKERLKTRKGAAKARDQCISNRAKTRKMAWKFSQQKAVKKCFGANVHGMPPKFTSVADLKRMAKEKPVSSARSESIASAKAVIEKTPVRTITPRR